jgi:hypothetical protein
MSDRKDEKSDRKDEMSERKGEMSDRKDEMSERKDEKSDIEQWYSTFFVRVPPDIISLQLCTPKVVGT